MRGSMRRQGNAYEREKGRQVNEEQRAKDCVKEEGGKGRGKKEGIEGKEEGRVSVREKDVNE